MKIVKAMIAVGAMYLSTTPTVVAGTFGEDCRSWAKAIYAIAEARDNLDDPSWEKLLKLHPILEDRRNINLKNSVDGVQSA